MSKHFLHSVLTVLVLTLAISNITVATSMQEAQNNVSVLSAQLGTVSARLHARILTTQVAPSINGITPGFGPIGTVVTITGAGFLPDNTVKFDFGSITHISSSDGKTLRFTVPSKIDYACTTTTPCPTNTWQSVVPRTYLVSVINASGSSNTLSFIVTTEGTGTVKINTLNKTTAKISAKVLVSGKGFTSKENTVIFGGYHRIEHLRSSDGKTLQFTVPTSLVYPCAPGTPCPTSTTSPVIPGTYLISITNTKGISNSVPLIVK